MWLALVVTILLIIAVFGFVLEPIVRGRSDRTVVDSVAVPDGVDALGDSDPDDDAEHGDSGEQGAEQHGALATEAGRAEHGS